MLTLKFDVRDKVCVCRDSVDAGLLPEVPETNSIIIASSGYVVAIGTEVHG